MQQELAASCDPTNCGPNQTQQAIQIIGIDAIGAESGNDLITQGRILPWLQDTPQQNVTDGSWHASKDDIFILDSANHQYTVVNLGTYDLASPANYASLKTTLLQAAHRPVP